MARKAPSPAKPATGIKQTIQARHGVATFVPQGYTIKIINTYGKQVVDTWAFALHAPPEDSDIQRDAEDEKDDAEDAEKMQDEGAGEKVKDAEEKEQSQEKTAMDTPPSAEEAEENQVQSAADDIKQTADKAEDKAEEVKDEAVNEAETAAEATKEKSAEGINKAQETTEQVKDKAGQATEKAGEKVEEATEIVDEKSADATAPKKSGWSAYIPSLPRKRPAKIKDKSEAAPPAAGADESMSKSWSSYLGVGGGGGQKDGSSSNTNSQKKGWSAYIPSGQAFSSYIPSNEGLSLSAFTGDRDPTKSYAEQLLDFSKTPVGAAGLSAATGSGYAGSIYAAYKAYEQTSGDRDVPAMEYMSMMHSRASTLHLCPQVGDTLVSNLRAPLLTVVEDTSPGTHDTLIAACDPQRYRELGVKKWEEHGSCSENCVLALKEINERSGLKGKRAIGSDVTVNTVPAPLNLFMNIPWTKEGEISFEAPTTKRGDYIKLRAERDVVVVMSACPQDVLAINGHKPMVAHFVVESSSPEDMAAAKKKEEEAKAVLEKAQKRMSSPQAKKAEEPKKEEAKAKASSTAPKKPDVPVPSANAPVNNPRPGKKAPRKLEKRGSVVPSPGLAATKV